MTKKDIPFEVSMDLFNYLYDGAVTTKGLENHWHTVFGSVVRRFGFSRKIRTFLWEGLVQGNWKRFHLTGEEKRLSSEYWLDEFKWEIYYCSDRWSLDRLTRCHWLYRQCMEALRKENDLHK